MSILHCKGGGALHYMFSLFIVVISETKHNYDMEMFGFELDLMLNVYTVNKGKKLFCFSSDLMLAVYAINEGMSNPFTWWHDFCRKPDFPSLQQFAIIRRNEVLLFSISGKLTSESKTLSWGNEL